MRALGEDSEHVVSTCRSMRRFAAWLGDPEFIEVERRFGVERAVPWDTEHGVVATAKAVITALTPPRHAVARGHRPTDAAPGRPPRRTMSAAPLAAEPQASTTPGSATVAPTAPASSARSEPDPVVRTGTFDIELLPARNGDCLWLTYGEAADLHHVMIDCGSRRGGGDRSRARVVGPAGRAVRAHAHRRGSHQRRGSVVHRRRRVRSVRRRVVQRVGPAARVPQRGPGRGVLRPSRPGRPPVPLEPARSRETARSHRS